MNGKGMFIWQNPACGEPPTIVALAQASNIQHVQVKIADGATPYYYEAARVLFPLLKAAGIEAWAWQYSYLKSPTKEASEFMQLAKHVGAAGINRRC